MRTTARTDPRHRHRTLALAAAVAGLAAAATACADARATTPPTELAELRRDHERCLVSEEKNTDGEVRYADYQACMLDRGWADPDLKSRG